MVSKLNQLLQAWPPNTVAALRWLRGKGIDRRLADKYVRSGWLERLGPGAYQRAGAVVDWPGAVYSLQTHLGLELHPGAITALELRGHAQYLSFGRREALLFGGLGIRLPAWFVRGEWSRPVTLVTTSVFGNAGPSASSVRVNEIDLRVATLERAAFEMMHLVPQRQSYEEALQVMESLASLRPQAVQRLLENCASVKAKRLFLHAAERFRHPWLKRLDLSKVNLGAGRRSIHPGGRLDRKYNLVVAPPPQG